jgi:methylated-DNA-[protein]-cysteine S-methyltransferase
VLDEAARQLAEYFAGKRRAFELPLKPSGSAFRMRVWQALREIPYGELRSYGDLAAKLKTAARAVGGACGANPIGIIVPCHRVVGGSNWLGGFSGGDGAATKRFLLGLESSGPLFANDKQSTDRETVHARTHDRHHGQGRRQVPGLSRHT